MRFSGFNQFLMKLANIFFIYYHIVPFFLNSVTDIGLNFLVIFDFDFFFNVKKNSYKQLNPINSLLRSKSKNNLKIKILVTNTVMYYANRYI